MTTIRMDRGPFLEMIGVIPAKVGSGPVAAWKDVCRVEETDGGLPTGRWIICKPVRGRLSPPGKPKELHLQMPPISASADCPRSSTPSL